MPLFQFVVIAFKRISCARQQEKSSQVSVTLWVNSWISAAAAVQHKMEFLNILRVSINTTHRTQSHPLWRAHCLATSIRLDTIANINFDKRWNSFTTPNLNVRMQRTTTRAVITLRHSYIKKIYINTFDLGVRSHFSYSIFIRGDYTVDGQ